MNYIEAFEAIKVLFKGANAKSIEGNCAIQVNMSDDDCGGAFYIEVKDGKINVEPYDYVDRNALLTADFKNLKQIVSGRCLITTAVAKEKAFVDGDIDVVAAIMKTVKKPAVKKPAVKKAAEKKTVEVEKTAAPKVAEKKTVVAEKPAVKAATKKTTKK